MTPGTARLCLLMAQHTFNVVWFVMLILGVIFVVAVVANRLR